MCLGGSQGSSTPVQYESQSPTVIAPPTTTVELDDSDIDTNTTDDTDTQGRETLRNDLTTGNMGNSLAGQGLQILGSPATKKKATP